MNEHTKAPGKAHRKGITLMEAAQLFSTEEQSEAWFVTRRWPNGIACPECGSVNIHTRSNGRKTPTYHCNDCKKDFTVKTGTIMHDSKLPLSKWGVAFYLFSTNLKGISSMKLHRELGITQKSAWHLAHRIRMTWNYTTLRFAGPTEVDETYMGGKEKNKHDSKKLKAGRGIAGKTAVIGARDRETGQVTARPITSTDKPTLQGFVLEHTDPGSAVYTDEHPAYAGIDNRLHGVVRHSAGEYVRQQAHTNGIESLWSMLKRGIDGTYHHVSTKHLGLYVGEFSGRHNVRPLDTTDQMTSMAQGSVGKRLQYKTLIG